MRHRVEKTDAEWRAELSPERYHICRERGTEPPFSGRYYAFKGDGLYRCGCCGAPLFDSRAKFDSGTGWPSFWAPIGPDALEERDDLSHGMHRIEVCCRTCGAHLGHVFPDGPLPTGLRYCINSLALEFTPRDQTASGGA